MKRSMTMLLAAAVVATPATALQARDPATLMAPADFGARARAILDAAFPSDGPGATVVMTRADETLFEGGRGLADVQAGTPLTAHSTMPLGSITKQFTAATVLQLASEGKLSLDDPVSRFFPDWPMPARQATVRQLLNHSSGLFDYTKVPGWIAQNREKSFTTSELVSIMRRHQAKAQPGSAWEYNNGGYVLLGAIIEQVTGNPWHEVVAQRIARPLSLLSIGYPGTPEAREAVVQGYGMGRDGLQPVALSNMSVPSAAGGLVGTPADLAKWARALHRGRVVPPALYKEMTSPAKLTGGKAEPYGFGLRLRKVRGQTAFVHGGALAGFRAESLYLPESNTFVAVFANSEDPQTNSETVMIRLAALAIGKPLPEFTKQPIDRAAVTPLFGLYEREKGAPVRFHERGGKLLLGIGEREMELTPAGGNRFFREPDGLSWIGFTRAADGTPVMRLYDPFSAEPEQIRRSGGVPAPLSVPTHILASYHGTYQTETVELIVGPGENGWLTVTVQGETKPLRPVAATEFMVEGTPMKLVFHPEGGTVNRLVLNRGARQLHGVRKAP